jgi:hypothetical protein
MTVLRILIAASPSISSSEWLERKLLESLPNDCELSLIGDSEHLRFAIERLELKARVELKTNLTTRANIRKILSDIDHVLLFWDGRSMTELLFQARLQGVPIKAHPFETVEIVNKEKTSDFDAYIGRGTPWGNPFQVGTQEGKFDRSEAIEKYKSHFESNILGDSSLRKGLLGLRGMRLACHCKPLPCHGDVIAAYLNSQDPEML